MKLYFLLFLCVLPLWVLGQQENTFSTKSGKAAVVALPAGDTTVLHHQKAVADSLLLNVEHQLDSLQGKLARVQHQLDSMKGKGVQGVEKVQDSLQQLLHRGQVLEQKLLQKQQGLAAPLVKAKAIQQQLSLESLSVSDLPGLDLSDVNLPEGVPQEIKLPEVDLSGVKISRVDVSELKLVEGPLSSVELPADQVPAIPGSALSSTAIPQTNLEYQLPGQNKLKLDELPKIDSSTFSGKNIDKKLEEQVLKQKEVAALKEQSGLAEDPLKDYLAMDAQALAKQQFADVPLTQDAVSKDQLQKQAVDHFAGKEKNLDKARQDLSKYKGRFSEIKSLKALPKNPLKRHPLMGVKWYKRVQPALQWQLGTGDAFRIDIGPRVSYLVTDKLELGASAQGRFSIGKAVPSFISFDYDRVWGYSLFTSYEIRKGFYGQISYEILNTQKIKLSGQKEDPDERLWVEGLRLGIGKRYTIYKRLRGYSLMEYNFSPSIHAPYRQQLQVKVGLMWWVGVGEKL